MLGHLRMTIGQAIDALLALALALFPGDSDHEQTPESNSNRLKALIEGILTARDIPLDTKLHSKDQPSKCKVCAQSYTRYAHL